MAASKKSAINGAAVTAAAPTPTPPYSEKDGDKLGTSEINEDDVGVGTFEDFNSGKVFVPDDNDLFIDPRLADYPIPLVAKTVDLHNDPTEPILTFRASVDPF